MLACNTQVVTEKEIKMHLPKTYKVQGTHFNILYIFILLFCLLWH